MDTQEIEKQYKKLTQKYLFSWNSIPGNDNVRLIEFLNRQFGIEWVEIAKIEKIEGDKTIKASTEKNYLLLILNDKKTKVNLIIDDGRTDEYTAEMENGKINIYAQKKYVEKFLEVIKTRNEIILSFLMFTVYTILLIHYLGLLTGFLTSSLSSYIGYHYWKYLMRQQKQQKKEDHENTEIIKKRSIIMYLVILIFFYILYTNFVDYFASPEITITSPSSGDIMKIDTDNSFSEIYGTSKNLAGNKFFHLDILYRRIDSDKRAGEWNFDEDPNPCILYKDGTWECRIQLKRLFAEWINGTLIVRQPTKNISTNVDIVAVITKQLIDPELRRFEYDYYEIPEHLIDDHIRIIPFIPEPFNLTGNPYGLLLTNRESQYLYYANLGLSIPADNVTKYCIGSQVVDIAGYPLQLDGKIINFTINKGNLTDNENITNSLGRASVCIISGEMGSGSILAESAGLHNATLDIAFTLPPVMVTLNQWINSSQRDSKTSEIVADFQTRHEGEYYATLTAWGTEAHWPLKPKEWPIVRIEIDGIVFEDIKVSSDSIIYVPLGKVLLNRGNHTLKVNMTNSFESPFIIGARNLYLKQVDFSNRPPFIIPPSTSEFK